MLTLKLAVVVVVLLACGVGVPARTLDQPTGYEGYQVVRITVRDDADVQTVCELQALGRDFEVWSEVLAIGPLEVRVAPSAQLALACSALPYEIVIADLQEFLDAQFAGTRARDFFDSLRTYSEHQQFMQGLVAAHPNLAQMVDIGTSVQGRSMWALRITGSGYAKPAIIYHGAEHGNEQAPASIVEYVANYLLTNYATDPNVAALVDNVEWYLLPIMNPDGYVAYDRYNAHDVDLNRNWAGPGSGQDPSGGPFPFSEPETQHMRDFLVANPTVRVHIDLHGYVPWIMWPWGHTPTHCPDHATFLAVGTEFRDRIITTQSRAVRPTTAMACGASGPLALKRWMIRCPTFARSFAPASSTSAAGFATGTAMATASPTRRILPPARVRI